MRTMHVLLTGVVASPLLVSPLLTVRVRDRVTLPKLDITSPRLVRMADLSGIDYGACVFYLKPDRENECSDHRTKESCDQDAKDMNNVKHDFFPNKTCKALGY